MDDIPSISFKEIVAIIIGFYLATCIVAGVLSGIIMSIVIPFEIIVNWVKVIIETRRNK
jgi:hypothetical protein